MRVDMVEVGYTSVELRAEIEELLVKVAAGAFRYRVSVVTT